MMTMFAICSSYQLVAIDCIMDSVTVRDVSPYEFVIEPKNIIPSLIQWDLEKDKQVAADIITVAQQLSASHNNGDFQVVISNKNGQLKVVVYVYGTSSHNSSSDCVFCKRQFKGVVLGQTDRAIAFEKSNPARNPINFLVIYKDHIVNYKEQNAIDAFLAQLELAQQLAKKLKNSTDVKLQINNGSQAAQTVFHTHMHFSSGSSWK